MKKIIFIVITIVCLISIYSSISSIYSLWQKRDILKTEKARLLKEQMENKNIKNQLQNASSPFYIEETARNKLFMSKKGENVALMEIGKSQTKAEKINSLPNWQKWWELFF